MYVRTTWDYLQQSSPKIQDVFVIWVALQVKGSIPISSLLQQQDLKDNTLCKWVLRREDTQIWVFCIIPKMGLILLEAIGNMLETYFEFGFPYGFLIGDSLRVNLDGYFHFIN